MQAEQVNGLIRKAVHESNRCPLMAFTDQAGLTQLLPLPFAHLNRNLSVVVLMPEVHAATEFVRTQPWIEMQFFTQSRDCFVRFGGRALVSQLDSAIAKLIEGYPFLESWFRGSADAPPEQKITLVQVHSQIIALEVYDAASHWFQTGHFRVINGEAVPIQAEEVGTMQAQGAGQLDSVRRIITRNRGDMIHSLTTNDFTGFSSYIAENFVPAEGKTVDDWINAQWKLYNSIEPGEMSYNWGLNEFELERDGSIQCRFFLEITAFGKKREEHHQEVWMLENSAWKLFKVF